MSPEVYTQLSNQEKLDLRRIRGQLSCAECRRLKLKCDKHIPCASCARRGCESICPTGTLSNGSGKKLVISDTGTLHQKVEEMGQRIQELEEALREFQASTSKEPHPLLRQELLVIKYPSGMSLPSTQSPDNTSMELSDALGTLTIGDHGDVKYFGHSAGTESLLLAGAEMHSSSLDNCARVVHRLSPNFPFNPSSGWDVEQSLEILYNLLPPKLRAWSLCETFQEHGNVGSLIMERSEVIADLLTPIYRYLGDEKERRQGKPPPLSCHKLAVLFLVFALGALVDLTLPPYNTEADNYFDLGCAALNLHHIFKSPELATVQAILLMATYLSHGGRRYTMDGAWSLYSLAAKLAQSLGLHRESPQWKMDAKTLNKRRKLFWEVFYVDTFMSLTLGRPPSIRLSYVDCQFPIDEEETLDNEGNRLPGNNRYRYYFTKKIVAKVVELVLGAKPPSYQTILELDKEFRQTRPPRHLKKQGKLDELSTPSQYMRGHFLLRLRGVTGLYIHRPFFVQAILGHPADPLCSPFAASYLAAYRCASGIIQSHVKYFAKFPLLLMRWWAIWSSLFSSAIIVGTIATRAPPSQMASKAFADLGLVVDLFEKGAPHSVRARSGLTILRPLRDKAVSIFSQRQDPCASSFPDDSNDESNAAADLELEIFGGHTKVIVSKMLSQRRTFKFTAEPPTSTTGSTPDPNSMPDESLVDYMISHIGDYTLYQPDEVSSTTYTSNVFSPIPTTDNDLLQDTASFENMDFSVHPLPPFLQQVDPTWNPTLSSFLSTNPDISSDSPLMQLLDIMPSCDNTQTDTRMSDEPNEWSSFMPDPPTIDVPTPNIYDM